MKSHERFLLEAVVCILKDAYNKCTAVEFDPRDSRTVESRLEHEGLSFLTITLPTLGSDLEKGLTRGWLEPTDFRSFRKFGRIPAFMRGIFALVFEQTTGRLLHEPPIEAIEGIRQVAYTFKKLEVDCTPSRIAAAIDGYRQCERDLREPITRDDEEYFLRVSHVLWNDVFHRVDPDEDLFPRHGPGATREGISGNRKYRTRNWYERLESYFPMLGTALPIRAYGSREFEEVTLVSEGQEQPVRVITVPKTLKGPRIIAIEPVCMQYTQQAIARYLMKRLEQSVYTAGHVNFTDQSVNQTMALDASKTGELATLDLSSASDRVPRSLALRMFDGCPSLREAIDACRSKRAELPNGDLIPLEKFASMGSALCFPVESMYFYTICVGALLEYRGLPVTSRNVYHVSRSVYVYGDDIIVPSDAAVVVADHLTRYKCKVNSNKSFWTGKFRESCGVDAYAGYVVTPTYIRQMPPCNKRSSSSIISWVKTSNLFYKKGYWLTARYLSDKVESIIGALPIVGERCAGLGLITFQGYLSPARVRGKYQRPEVRAWVPSPVYREDKLDGYHALAKCLLWLEQRGQDADPYESKHLSRTARHGAVTLKRRWVPPA